MTITNEVAPGRVPFTWRKLVTAGAMAACASAVTATFVQAQPAPGRIEWSIDRDGSSADAHKIQLTIESRWSANNHSMWSNDRPISDLQGLTAAQLTGPRGPVRFALVKDAGRLDCSGTAGNLSGSGACSFTADPGFTSYLQARGMGTPTSQQAFTLTMSGVGRDLVDSMQEIGYARPTVEQLSSMGIHGVTADFIRGLARSGYRLKSADDLVNFAIHGVTLDYIREMAAINPKLQRLSGDELVNMRIHGVTPDYVRQIAAMGPQFREIGADDLVNFAIHGARPDLVRAYAAYTRGALHPDDVVNMAIHGVSARFLDQLTAAGYRDFSADDLVNLSIHGVSGDYVRRLQQSGMAHVSADQLVRLRNAGFEPQ
jgi:hypothetical protein